MTLIFLYTRQAHQINNVIMPEDISHKFISYRAKIHDTSRSKEDETKLIGVDAAYQMLEALHGAP